LPGSGGIGGGGTGGNAVTAFSGNVNTGGGGGGGGVASASGQGGSGIVVIRYLDGFAAANSTTGTPNVTVAGGYRTYKWTSSGSITF
jgi:hypothetical protein